MALMGALNAPGLSGSAKRVGGLFAKGTPRNLLTVAVAAGSEVVVPMTTPASIVAVAPPPRYPQDAVLEDAVLEEAVLEDDVLEDDVFKDDMLANVVLADAVALPTAPVVA